MSYASLAALKGAFEEMTGYHEFEESLTDDPTQEQLVAAVDDFMRKVSKHRAASGMTQETG